VITAKPFLAWPDTGLVDSLRKLAPGLLLAGTIAFAAKFVSAEYGGPVILLALLLGMAFNFLSSSQDCAPGINFASRSVLRIGVVLMGAAITMENIVDLGLSTFLLVACGLTFALIGGYGIGRLFGLKPEHAILTAGSVGICGASAAMAISCVLSKSKETEQNTLHTVVGVTTLSTLAMVLYPLLTRFSGFDDVQAGTYLGATIHDVAQVIGAGYLISDEAGQTAAIVKLTRVAMLAPIVVMIALFIKSKGQGSGKPSRTPGVPLFVLGFVALMIANSLGWLPRGSSEVMSDAARWCLVIAVAGLGVKTSVRDLIGMGHKPVLVLCVQTAALAAFAWLGLMLIAAL